MPYTALSSLKPVTAPQIPEKTITSVEAEDLG